MKYSVKVKLKFCVNVINGSIYACYSWYSPIDGSYDCTTINIRDKEAPEVFLDRVKKFLTSGKLSKVIVDKELVRISKSKKESSASELVKALNEAIRKDNEFTVDIEI